MIAEISTHANYFLAGLLLFIGLYGMMVSPNFMRKLIAMNIFQVGTIVFFLTVAQKKGATTPILPGGHAVDPSAVVNVASFVNPLPHALMLTAIVVSVSTAGLALALLIRIHRRYGTLQERIILKRMSEWE